MPAEYEVIKEHDICPNCGYGIMKASDQKDDDGNCIYMSCSECDTHQLMYIPMEHQNEFHSDAHKYKGFFGGYG